MKVFDAYDGVQITRKYRIKAVQIVGLSRQQQV